LTFTGGKTTKSIPGLTDVTVINIPGKDTTDIHVPVTSGMVPSSRGTGEVTVYDRLLEFLEDHLKGSQARAPAPEARPNQRWFEKSVMVELAGSGPGSVIRYTTDGSNPDLNSPIYQRPFEIHAATEVKAISVVDGMRPSGPMTARFFLGTPPPAVTAPEGLVLPPARVGEPYSVTFRAPGAQRWQIIVGSHPPRPKENGGKVAEFAKDVLLRDGIGVRLGLTMASNGDTASLQGTPNRPGWTTVLVAASHAQGQGCPVSGDRLYLLRIDP
jgi:hypothetical protein